MKDEKMTWMVDVLELTCRLMTMDIFILFDIVQFCKYCT